MLATRLLSVVRALVLELTPERAHLDIHLDSDLDRELGFDSLSRIELLFRLERDLNVQIPEQAYASAENATGSGTCGKNVRHPCGGFPAAVFRRRSRTRTARSC